MFHWLKYTALWFLVVAVTFGVAGFAWQAGVTAATLPITRQPVSSPNTILGLGSVKDAAGALANESAAWRALAEGKRLAVACDLTLEEK